MSCHDCVYFDPGLPYSAWTYPEGLGCNHETAYVSGSLPTFPFQNGCKHFRGSAGPTDHPAAAEFVGEPKGD